MYDNMLCYSAGVAPADLAPIKTHGTVTHQTLRIRQEAPADFDAMAQEYMRKLGKCLLSLQQDRNGGARPLLDLWVAEAIALICCVRVYNPEFMKAIDSTAMNGSAAARPGHPLLMQHLVS